MKNKMQNLLDQSLYEQFEYQLVYLRPTAHAEEQLTVGVIAMSNSGFELRLVSSVAALDLMTKIVGDSGVEQFHFAAGELRRSVSRLDSWESLAMTTDLLIVGEKISAFTRDRSGLLTSVLASASSLIRGSSTRAGEVVTPSPTMKILKELYHEVSLLNPLIADDLFHRKVTLDKGSEVEEVELPIFGNRIFGAPVSLLTATSDQKMRVEAYVAKFHWLQQFLHQRPKVYILAPDNRTRTIAQRAHSSIRELRAVAKASNVELGISESMAELAAFVIKDEAA